MHDTPEPPRRPRGRPRIHPLPDPNAPKRRRGRPTKAESIAIAAATKRFDGFVALGCVLRGETSHYDIVANLSARGLVDLTMKGLCIGNGILTCENEQQAMARARVSEMDKGGGAAEAALAMVRLRRRIGSKDKHR